MLEALSFILVIIAEFLLEALYFMLYPLWYPIIRFKKYQAAAKPSFQDSQGGILIHAASVGEINALRTLVTRLRQLYPQQQIVITTTTLTGLEAASKIDPAIQTGLSVFDIWHLRSKQLAQINPGLICIMETEIWFNLLAWALLHRKPVLFLNARLSEKSLGRYLKLKPLFSLVGSSVKEILAQSSQDAERFKQLFKTKVSSPGNLKFALDLSDYNSKDIREQWGYTAQDFILVWGSSRPGEEALILSILPQLRAQIPKLKLILAIRHPKRLAEVLDLLSHESYSLFSKHETAAAIYIIDEIGHLNQAYSICDLAIVGGSFYDFGGHNPLEPAFYEKAIIIGEYHHSCLESVKQLKQEDAILISNPDQLLHDIIKLSADPDLRRQMGQNAKKVLSLNAKSLGMHLDGIARWRK